MIGEGQVEDRRETVKRQKRYVQVEHIRGTGKSQVENRRRTGRRQEREK